MSSGDRFANPATWCASGRSGLWRGYISGSIRKRSGLGMLAPSEEGFRVVSLDSSCQFAISRRSSDFKTRQSVAYCAPPPKNGNTESAYNLILRSVKRIWGPLLFLRRLWERRPDARGLRPMRTSPQSGAANTSFYGVRLPSVSSGGNSNNPATSCASGRISQSPPGNVVALECPPPLRRVSEWSVQMLPVGSPFQDIILTAQLYSNPETSLERLVPLVEF